ncbi:hypothetical protein EFL26_13300 [Nocardioides pocheonensis]|uniref:Uncharacterized protein n=1 Tax=Nocardioides pocheonensis TaxID=661485 RepID=A0A3N0GN78_9ACTN|nr:hypothetical protein EFL26_13300 [Nocardioides pocheonensis]
MLRCSARPGRPHRIRITLDSEDRRHTWVTVHHELSYAGDAVRLGPVAPVSGDGRGVHLTVTD